ncbi:ABC transporter permease [Mycoplasma buteonis]|uniref:ABC transporter permease n=1 Tax=Mycoplasma buteonis TaxID=171280 RepID=UPI000A71DB55|nr:ABC transporter permease [Mycoplasma buteonis]
MDANGKLILKDTLGTGIVKSLPPAYNPWVNREIFFPGQQFQDNVEVLSKEYHGYVWNNFILNPSSNVPDSSLSIKQDPATKVIYVNTVRFLNAINTYTLLLASKLPTSATEQQVSEAVNLLHKLNGTNVFYPNSILGTNSAGIDVWTSSWIGTWNAIRLALIVATLQTIIGVAVGSYLGFHVGSWIDTVIMRLIEIFVAPPGLIWLLLFASIFGTSDWTLIFALVFTGWTGSVGGTRMFIITVKDSEFITASKSVGASKMRLIYKHALPAIIGKIANSYVARIPGIILSVSSLAFLGFFKGDTANLGALLSSAAGEAGQNFWILLLPSLILLSISVSLHFMALGIHDALDPKVIRGK